MDGWIDGMGVYGGVREWSWGVLDGFGMNEIITETAAKKKRKLGREKEGRGQGEMGA